MGKYYGNKAFESVYEMLEKSGRVKNKTDFARTLGVSYSTITEILGGRQGVTVDLIQKICDTYKGVQPNDFFLGDFSIGGDAIRTAGDATVIKQSNNSGQTVGQSYGSIVAGGDGSIEKALDLLLGTQAQLSKAQEQIDRLLAIIEKR